LRIGLGLAVHHEVGVLAMARLQRIDRVDQRVGGARGLEAAGRTGGDIADIAPAPAAVGDIGVGEKALRLVGAVAGDEGRAFLLGKDGIDLAGDPASISTAASSSSACVAAGMA
jgi:hypothetical protein